MFSKRSFSFISMFVLLAVMLALATPVLAGGTQPSVSNMYKFPDGANAPGGKSQLLRKGDMVEYHLIAKDLAYNHAYTLWAVVFNHPEFCTDGVCGEDDVFIEPGVLIVNDDGTFGTQNVHVSAFWAGDGDVANRGGVGEFRGEFGEDNLPGQLVFGAYNLEDAQNAEIHFILRSHGPANENPVTLEEQLTTIGGGCLPPDLPPGTQPVNAGECSDMQFAIHTP